MSPKKIIFFIVAGVITLGIIITIVVLSNRKKDIVAVPASMKIWIQNGTTETYDTLIAWFKEYAPEYKNTDIVFEKKTTDPIRYRTLLLSTMADGVGPDIFMVGAGADVVLESKIEPIPSDVLDFGDFEKRYDDVFSWLIVSSGAKDDFKRYLYGVPLGFEIMGIFYNKNLVREVPKTWNDLDILYNDWTWDEVFVSNLGLGPRYTQNATDVVGLFLSKWWTRDILKMDNGWEREFERYLSYKDISIPRSGDDAYSTIVTLAGSRESMDTEKLTTLDLFMQWDIAMILWYPSLVEELEKSDKRLWLRSKAGSILTENIPLPSPTEARENIAKFDFFAISKSTKNPTGALKFMEYLMTTDAQKRFLQNNKTQLAAQREFWIAQEDNSLSNILSRTSMNSFIPDSDEKLFVFSYWLKAEFDTFLSDYIDRNDNIDINNIWELISEHISCSIDTYNGDDVSADCEKK